MVFSQKGPTIEYGWEIRIFFYKIQNIFVCTIYKSPTMQKKLHRNEGVTL